MFNLQGKKDYKVVAIYGGVSSKGSPYSFLTVESELIGGQKFPDRMKINLWGADLSNQIKANDFIKILGATEVGLVKKKAPNSDKWYENLTITCNVEDVVVGEKPAEQPKEIQPIQFEEIDSSELPF